MIIKPMVRGNVCLNSHPKGCKKAVEHQIAYTKKRSADFSSGTVKPKNALILGCSNGYGLASRITAAFGYGAATIGVSFEKAGSETKWGTPGWYNNLAFDGAAKAEGLVSITIEGDAFSDAIKAEVIKKAKEHGMNFDLVIYSLASPLRIDPDTGVTYKSVLKPFGKAFTGKTLDPFTGKLSEITAEPATEEEAAATVKVMGGEDWQRWIEQLSEAGVLAEGCITAAYSYIGPEATQALYRKGTIGKAKEHLEKTAHILNDKMKTFNGKAFVSVNKGLVTRASAVIPVIPLYLASLFKVMKEKGNHEGCIEQINRLFSERLYTKDGKIPVDGENRIRIDDWELDDEVQAAVDKIMEKVTDDNSETLTDLAGYRHDFLAANGFDIDGIDYDCDVERCDGI
ncbi:enoyl-ACP reductase FabV [Treponema pedis]|uniref:enoyl-ACP reductase FabV n=1 Tax=Treponema pedis TaxID=409322 RepID=UPI0004011328|nr:enoyl-ACP reductase FabV [Treponema pedis]